MAILLPAWLPNRPAVQIERGTVELLQAFLLAAAAAVMFGTSSHAGFNRPVCRILALGLLAAFVGEIEDFISGILRLKFPEGWVIGILLLIALSSAFRHRRVNPAIARRAANRPNGAEITLPLRMVDARPTWEADEPMPEIPSTGVWPTSFSKLILSVAAL